MNKLLEPVYYTTRKDGVDLYITKSPNNKMIIQVETGIEYSEAIDVYPVRYTYIESKKDIPAQETQEV
jgi:hypothetical protein